jgi:head-tail adaptor
VRAPVLARRLSLEERVTVPDGAGGFAVSWLVRGIVWAEVTARSGGEGEAGGRELSLTGYRIVLRASPFGSPSRPRPDMRFADGARVFNILAVTEADPNGRYLVCYAEEGIAK